MRDNCFYHIECKTLGDASKQTIIRDEVYKKWAISALLGKGEKRAVICTTLPSIDEPISTRANDYGVEMLSIKETRKLKNRLMGRFGVRK